MISLNWIMVLPDGFSEQKFDDWYLGTHTKYGKASRGIIRYTVNRVLGDQPDAAEGDVYRVAQEYWPDWDALDACWNSPSGHAVLGDGLVNIGLDPGTIPAISLTEDRQLPVANGAQFSTAARGYRGREDGTHVKFLAYGFSDSPAIDAWYADEHSGLGQDPAVREHIFGKSVGKTLEIGYLSTLPGEDQKAYDWLLELWFDGPSDATAFLAKPEFEEVWSSLRAKSSEITSALFRGQEMLVVVDPVDHVDD